MDQDSIQKMLSRDKSEWSSLTAFLDAHPSEPLHKDGPAWNSRDIYSHLARWLDHSNSDMERYPSSSIASFAPEEIETMNARWQREDSSLAFNEARSMAFAAFERRLSIITATPIEKWDEQFSRIVHYDGADHVTLHLSYISVG